MKRVVSLVGFWKKVRCPLQKVCYLQHHVALQAEYGPTPDLTC